MGINGLHGIFYTTEPEAARAFLRDKIGFPFHDAGDGWLIFELSEGHVGVHPSDHAFNGVSFSCDNLDATIKEASAKGVEFSPIVIEDWGKTTTFVLPGGGPIMVYEPTYTRS